MTPEQAIEWIEDLRDGWKDKDNVEACNMAIDALEQSKWIPVSERLPEECVDVLVWFEYYRYGEYCCPYQTYGISYVYKGRFSDFVNGESGWRDLKIIAWMPVPEPYQAESEDKE